MQRSKSACRLSRHSHIVLKVNPSCNKTNKFLRQKNAEMVIAMLVMPFAFDDGSDDDDGDESG